MIEVICIFNSSFIRHVNCLGGAVVSMFALNVVNCGFEPLSGQTKDQNIGICYLSTKYAALRSKSKEIMAGKQDNVYLWTVVSVKYHYKNPIKRVE